MPLTVAMALSGIEPEHWGGELKDMYNQGACAISKPQGRCYSAASSGVSSCVSSESGISSLSPRSDRSATHTCQDLHAIYLELISKLEKLIGNNNLENFKKKVEPKKVKLPEVKVICGGRDILDLGTNMKQPWFFRPAELPIGVIDNNYFQNRSQYSRIANVMAPPHMTETCHFDNCDFNRPIYF